MSVDVFLTGADGQVGWEIARQAPQALTVHATMRKQLDITDRASVIKNIESKAPKVVINAAAYTAVDQAESDEAGALAVNRDGAANLAHACRLYDVPLIHLSTDYIFDGSKTGPYIETDNPAPLGIYGKSKLAGETAIQDEECAYVILRTAWVYGVHGNNFVKTMLRLGKERESLQVVDDQFGNPTFAKDLARAVISISERMITGTCPPDGLGTFHCVGGGHTTWHRFACKIFEIADPASAQRPEVEPISTAQYPTPTPRPLNSILDSSKLKQVYDIALRPWEKALEDMLNETLKADAGINTL